MENIISEKFLNDTPEPLSIKSIETILDQMKNSICKIYNGKQGTGFFIKIPFNDIQLPVLITNNHIIDENDYINKKIITIYIGNENNGQNLKLDEKRKFYTNKNYDTTIIEIKEDIDGIKNFLILDDKIIECLSMNKDEISEFLKNIYLNKSIYILNYPEGKEIVASIGQPAKFIGHEINHKCNTKTGSSGSPILLCENQKVIGVHFGLSNDFNKGIFIIYSIINFNQENNYKSKNSIDLLHKDNENSILEKNKSINESLNSNEIQLKAEKYMKNIKLINLLGNQYIEKNKVNCELGNIQYEENWSKNEFNIEKIGETAYKLYQMCKDIKSGIDFDKIKYFKKEYEKYHDRIIENIFHIENIGTTSEIGVICKVRKPLSLDLEEIPLIIISSKLLSVKNIIIGNKKIDDLINRDRFIKKERDFDFKINDNNIIYKNKYIIIIRIFSNWLVDRFFNNCIYLDDFNDIPIKEINYNHIISLGQNEILLVFKINLSDIDKKIYFVYNEKKYLYESIIEGEENNNHKKYFIPKKEGIYKVKLIFKNTIKDCNNMFCNLENLVYADLSHLDTKNVDDMSFMFYYCKNLKRINLSSFKTQNVTDMSYMFCGCSRLEKIDLSSFKTDNVRNMECMFMFCKTLKEIDLNTFETSKVISMRSMFKYCISLEDVNLLSFKTENVNNMNYIFQNCPYYALRRIDLSSFNFKNVCIDNMNLMFFGYSQEIYIKKDSNFKPNSKMCLAGRCEYIFK